MTNKEESPANSYFAQQIRQPTVSTSYLKSFIQIALAARVPMSELEQANKLAHRKAELSDQRGFCSRIEHKNEFANFGS